MSKFCNDRGGDDKWLHAFLTFVIGGVLAGLLSMIHFPTPWLAASIVLLVCMAVGVGKELHDARQDGNHFCVWDLLYDLAGAIPASVIAFLANYFTWHTQLI